jgi:hypothetical protein
MTVIEIDSKKQHLIEEIKEISDDNLLLDLERLIQQWKAENAALLRLVKPRRKTLDMDELKKEQNYKGFDKNLFKSLIKDLDIQEPIEELVKMI